MTRRRDGQEIRSAADLRDAVGDHAGLQRADHGGRDHPPHARRRAPGSLVLQIIVVDDGSSDGTDKVLDALEDSTVHVITHEENQGKGAAIRTGLAEAG